jgi:rubrerythrin
VIKSEEFNTHTVFFAEVKEAFKISNEQSLTYQYYFDHIKPKPIPKKDKQTGYICKICGYIYEGEPLPEDFICPLCKHGAADFEKL